MSVKIEPGRRSVTMQIDLPGTPEQVWQAVATGPGNAAWFVRARIDEAAGGDLAFDFGGGAESQGTVTTWDPPHRFGYEERDWKDGGPPVATEITVEALSGATCRFRMVHAIFTDRDDWDGDLESWESGWPGFLRVLRLYLETAPGAAGAPLWLTATFAGDVATAHARLLDRLGLSAPRKGAAVSLDAASPPMAGTVVDLSDAAADKRILLRLDQPVPGVMEAGAADFGGPVKVGFMFHFWGPQAETTAAAARAGWQAVLDRIGPG
jgi:uncharacterized protein YndB with AHSA1/START domain